jgi:hypothetical protein
MPEFATLARSPSTSLAGATTVAFAVSFSARPARDGIWMIPTTTGCRCALAATATMETDASKPCTPMSAAATSFAADPDGKHAVTPVGLLRQRDRYHYLCGLRPPRMPANLDVAQCFECVGHPAPLFSSTMRPDRNWQIGQKRTGKQHPDAPLHFATRLLHPSSSTYLGVQCAPRLLTRWFFSFESSLQRPNAHY